ncbi:MAG: TatD family hydrolase, partial [Candidatus Nomurabacteria bacterium]|nr:TatD family hydrolase [Candidatus Nomurabacteria bacterium]
IGEIGLDYHYDDAPPAKQQIAALNWQLDLTARLSLPVSFHIREAFGDFWPALDRFEKSLGVKIRGALHSFTDNSENLEKGLASGFLVGVNGIATYKLRSEQKLALRNLPLDKMILETDAPFLAPVPHKSETNQPAFILDTAKFLAAKRGVSLENLAEITTQNAAELFDLKI